MESSTAAVAGRIAWRRYAMIFAPAIVAAVDFDQLGGDIQFNGYSSGVDAASLSGGPTTGPKGSWGQQARSIHIDKLRQHTLATTAATFTLVGLNIDVAFGTHECF